MSDLISELRVNCQTLQTELTEVRAVSKDRSDAAVQASLIYGSENSRPSTRKLSTSSITQESIRKARSVYGVKQPKPRYSTNNNNTASSMTALNNRENECHRPRKNTENHHPRSSSMSPAKMPNGSARIAKPVNRIHNNTQHTLPNGKAKVISNGSISNTSPSLSLNSKLPVSPGSNVSSTLSTSVRTTPSRIPQPETPSPRKSRIPSAPRYITPNRNYAKSPSNVGSPASVASPVSMVSAASTPQHMTKEVINSPAKVAPSVGQSPKQIQSRPVSASTKNSFELSSPPPPPPPTEMEVEPEIHVNEITQPPPPIIEPSPIREESLSPSPQVLPPAPPVSRISSQTTREKAIHSSASTSDEELPPEAEILEEEEDEEIIRVTADGHVELALSSKASSQVESPIVPSMIGKSYSQRSNSGSNSGSGSGSEENPSADDEGSRNGDDCKVSSPETSNSVDCTPRLKKKVEHFRQGLAARRIQRTWKHFYEELEERKEVKDELPAQFVQGICVFSLFLIIDTTKPEFRECLFSAFL